MPDVKWYSGGSTTFSVDITPTAADGAAVGTSALPWSDLFLAAGGVINWSAGEITVTHTAGATPYLRLAGGNLRVATAFMPVNSDGAALGSTETMWSDAFFASGAVLNFDNGDVTLTHSANLLTLAGGNLAITAGLVQAGNGSATTPTYSFGAETNTGAYLANAGVFTLVAASTAAASVRATGLDLGSDGLFRWTTSSGNSTTGTVDTAIARNAAGVVEINSGTAGTRKDLRVAGIYAASAYASVGSVAIAHASGYIEVMEQAAPSAGERAAARLYVDTSAGKRRIMAIFGTGAAQVVATEP